MKKLSTLFIFSSLAFGFFIIPGLAMASHGGPHEKTDVKEYGGIIPCGFDYDNSKVVTDDEQCHFEDVLILFKNLMDALIKLSTLLLVGAMIYVGFRLLVSQGNPAALGEAKSMALNFLWGYFWIMIAWVLINTISNALLKDGFSLLKN